MEKLARRLGWAFVLLCWGATADGDPLPRFPDGAVWNQDISNATTYLDSGSMITTLQGLGGFGNGRMQIDFSIRVVHAPAQAPTETLVKLPGVDLNDRYYTPDCEALGASVPVPPGASIENSADMTCVNQGDNAEDCHYLVVQDQTLYEVYRANLSPDGLTAQCLAVWDLGAVYPPEGRGEHCTSADAAGFPISALLFNADEVFAATQVASGDLGHAIRFTLPNSRMASDSNLGGEDGKLYVRPASHAGNPFGPAGSVPYGARLRLRSNFPFTGYNAAAQVILRTMQKYGIVLADGGNIALTAESDLYNTHKWAELDMDPDNGGSRIFDQTQNATDVAISDFAVIDTGPRIAETYECVRAPAPSAILFADGFE